MTRAIPFCAKRPLGPEPWVEFGASQEVYDLWVPHVCAMACCRSLVLAKRGSAPSLWALTELARDLGVYRNESGEIRGAFHYPLVELLARFAIPGRVFGDCDEEQVASMLDVGPVMLSIDLHKVDGTLSGGHLILLTDRHGEVCVAHDNARLLSESGCSVRLEPSELSAISNRRGIALNWVDAQAAQGST